MVNYNKKIKNIILYEFTRLLETIEDDFIRNYKRKKHNFLLNQMDDNLIAGMVFVSSFESKSGIAIENVAERITRLTFGSENVPNILNPFNLDISDLNISDNSTDPLGQLLVTNVDLENGNLHGEISAFRANNVASGRGRKRQESKVNNQTIQEHLHPLTEKYQKDIIITKPIDLIFFDGTNWNISEVKAGGDLDSSNAPANVEKLLSLYVGFGDKNAKVDFATLYHKDGEGNTWTGAVKKHLQYPEMFLIGKDFWNKILPDGVSYSLFVDLYREALQEINLSNRIQYLIDYSR